MSVCAFACAFRGGGCFCFTAFAVFTVGMGSFCFLMSHRVAAFALFAFISRCCSEHRGQHGNAFDRDIKEGCGAPGGRVLSRRFNRWHSAHQLWSGVCAVISASCVHVLAGTQTHSHTHTHTHTLSLSLSHTHPLCSLHPPSHMLGDTACICAVAAAV